MLYFDDKLHNKLDIKHAVINERESKLKLDMALKIFIEALQYHPCYATNLINHMLITIRQSLNKCFQEKNANLYLGDAKNNENFEIEFWYDDKEFIYLNNVHTKLVSDCNKTMSTVILLLFDIFSDFEDNDKFQDNYESHQLMITIQRIIMDEVDGF